MKSGLGSLPKSVVSGDIREVDADYSQRVVGTVANAAQRIWYIQYHRYSVGTPPNDHTAYVGGLYRTKPDEDTFSTSSSSFQGVPQSGDEYSPGYFSEFKEKPYFKYIIHVEFKFWVKGQGTVKIEIYKNSDLVKTIERDFDATSYTQLTINEPINSDETKFYVGEDDEIKFKYFLKSNNGVDAYLDFTQDTTFRAPDGAYSTQGARASLNIAFNILGYVEKNLNIAFNVLQTHLKKYLNLKFNVLKKTFSLDNSVIFKINGAIYDKIGDVRIINTCFTPESNSDISLIMYFTSPVKFDLDDSVEILCGNPTHTEYIGKIKVIKQKSMKLYDYVAYSSAIDLPRVRVHNPIQGYLYLSLYNAFQEAKSEGYDFETPALQKTDLYISNPISVFNLSEAINRYGQIKGTSLNMFHSQLEESVDLVELPATHEENNENNIEILEEGAFYFRSDADKPDLVIGNWYPAVLPWYATGELSSKLFTSVIGNQSLVSKTATDETTSSVKLWNFQRSVAYFSIDLDKEIYAKSLGYIKLLAFTPWKMWLHRAWVGFSVKGSGTDIYGNSQFFTVFAHPTFRGLKFPPFIGKDNTNWYPFEISLGGSNAQQDVRFTREDKEFWIDKLEFQIWPAAEYILIDALEVRSNRLLAKNYYGTPGRTREVQLHSTVYDAAVKEVETTYNSLQIQEKIEFSTPLRLSLFPPFQVSVSVPEWGVSNKVIRVFSVEHDLRQMKTKIRGGIKI